MRKSLIASFALHALILAAALVVLPNPDTFKVQLQDPIQVDISMIGDVSKRQAQSKTADKKVEKAAPKVVEQPKKAEPKPKVAEVEKKAPAEPPPPPEPKPPEPKKEEPKPPEPKPLDSDPLKKLLEKQEEPKPLDPDPLKDLLKKTEEEKKPEKKPEKKVADAKPVEKKKPEKKKPKLDVNDLSAFLNKEDTEQAAPQKQSDETGSPTQGTQNVQGTDDALAATLIEAMISRLKECWSVPPGAREADISVRVRFRLNPDATVAGLPEVLNSSGDPVFPATAQSAVSAVTGCEFADLLPPDKYELWKEITVNFNPNMMFGT